MALGRGQWLLRALGVLFGLGLCALGAFSYFGGGTTLAQPVEQRAAGFGITLMVVGAIAIIGSLLARRVDRLWYRKPPRWRMLHGEQTDWRKWWRP
jgi:uncharacterized membrane protein YbhN (UPF0104 family)